MANWFTPTITIYQNAGHVAAILQQQTNAGLIHARQFAAEESASSREKQSSDVGAGGSVKAKAPVVGALGANVSGKRLSELEDAGADKVNTTESYSYTDAYHLHLARTLLQDASQLRNMNSVADARALDVGSFVEFSADFRPNELTTILDVATPDLVAEVVRYMTRTSEMKLIDFENYERMKAQSHEMAMKADARSDLAAAITSALRADFRSETTREYYGSVRDTRGLTAITVCEANAFTTADPDRMLDGTFTVLGKVVSHVQRNVPSLQRNKLLSRFHPDVVDSALAQLNDAMSDVPDMGDVSPSEIMDAAFSSRIRGTSIRIIPIAIYA